MVVWIRVLPLPWKTLMRSSSVSMTSWSPLPSLPPGSQATLNTVAPTGRSRRAPRENLLPLLTITCTPGEKSLSESQPWPTRVGMNGAGS